MPRRRAVGTNVLRKEGIAKKTGRAQIHSTTPFPRLLHARTIRSTIPAGEISASVRFRPPGFTIVDHRDIPGRNVVALIDDDQPCLAERDGPPRRGADPAARARGPRARCWRADVQIDYRAGDADLRSRAVDACRSRRSRIDKGDVERGLAEADAVVEGEYRTAHQEQLYIEPNGVIAVPETTAASRCTARCSARTTCTGR